MHVSLLVPFLPLLAVSASTASFAPLRRSFEELDIPVSAILANDLSSYTSSSLWPMFCSWKDSRPDLEFLHGKTDDEELPQSVICDTNVNTCLLRSTASIDPAFAASMMAMYDQDSGVTSSGKEKREIVKRANSVDYKPFTHWKTYPQKTGPGDEHYTTYDFRCGRLDYRSTGYYLSNFDASKNFQKTGNNNMHSFLYVKNYGSRNTPVTLKETFACSIFGNNCCNVQHDAVGQWYTLGRFTWECYSNTYIGGTACQG